ncbi:MAG: flagellar hook-associated protein FlgK [Syntrophomonadaceae bacterium]|nr:flagellar hook-associated protein FlgK [Syntrophomonadaceae bacterium]
MSLFFGINIALKGMMAQQTALNVTSHNIANANTEGYSRQRVNLETSVPISGLASAGQLGSGVDIAEIVRIKDEFLNYQVRKETSRLENHIAVSHTLQQVEAVFNEPLDTGFNEQLSQFWNSWQELAKAPESSPVRTVVKEAAGSLTDTLRQMSAQLHEIKDDINSQIQLAIKEVNSLSTRVARLNDQIVNVNITGQNANDFMDARDLALNELAALGNISLTDCLDANGKPTGAIEVKLGNITIVDAAGAHEISSSDINPDAVTDGELAGLLQAGGNSGQSNTVQFYIDKLNTLAVGIAKSINDIHTTGKDLDGNSGQDFFVFKDNEGELIDLTAVDWNDPWSSGLSAANIYLNANIENDVAKIAASKQGGIFLEGNGDIALAIAELKHTLMKYDPASQMLTNSNAGNLSLGAFYQDMIAELGSAARETGKTVKNQQTLVDQNIKRRESIQGVSLDEETVNMVLYQHAFDASAKVISVMDEMMDTIINRLKA